MPWLAELGIEAVGSAPLADAVEPAPNGDATDGDHPPAEPELMATSLDAPLDSLAAEAVASTTPGATDSTAAQDATPPATADETLALLREPDELIPVTVQVLEEAQAPAEVASQPEAPKEEPPLSPDEMAELARGLLEVVLR